MNRLYVRTTVASRMFAASLAITGLVAGLFLPALARAQPAQSAMAPAPAPAVAPREALSWTFDSAQSADGGGWSAERGRITVGDGKVLLRPDANRRVVLLSPPGLPDAARYAQEFVLGLAGTGLERVRIQVRRDARGGWITVADASGAALRAVPDGFAINRNLGAIGAPVERIRIELQLRTTNARQLQRIDAIPAPAR